MVMKFILPVEPLFALGIVGVLGVGTTFLLEKLQLWENDGKPRRYNLDKWDRNMMERDSRLSGNVNVQSFQVEAPPAFSRNSALELEKPILTFKF